MKNIFDVLRTKEAQLQQLEQEVAALRLAARLLSDEQEARTSKSHEPITQPEMIRSVMLEADQPMHSSAIGEALQRKYKKKIKPTHIVAIIYRCIKNNRLFYKVEDKSGTFYLLEKRQSPEVRTLKAIQGNQMIFEKT